MCLVGPADHPVQKEKGGDSEDDILYPEHGGRAETRERSTEQGRERLKPDKAGEISENEGERGRDKAMRFHKVSKGKL